MTRITALATASLALALAAAPGAKATPAVTGAPSLSGMRTEEGQLVIYDRYTWQRRELDKRLPLNEAWPADVAVDKALTRFGLDRPSLPATIPVPSRIMTDVYLVNSDPNHTYLIDAGPAGLVLIDPGLETNAASIIANVERLGFRRSDIRWVLNTHGHFDHSMADAHFQRLGAKIYVGRGDVAAVEKGTEATGKTILPSAMRSPYPTLTVDHAIDDGEDLVFGDKTFRAIATPGHTSGSTCFLLTIDGRNVLFSGDTVLFDYRLGYQGTISADDSAYLGSLKKLEHFGLVAMSASRVRWNVLLPGHGTIVLDRAYLDVLKAVRQVEWDVLTNEGVKALPFADDAYRKFMFGRPSIN